MIIVILIERYGGAMKSIVVLLILLLSTSCAIQEKQLGAVTKRASFDLNCPQNNLSTTMLNSSEFGTAVGVTGCGQRATYIVQGSVLNGFIAIMNTDTKSKN